MKRLGSVNKLGLLTSPFTVYGEGGPFHDVSCRAGTLQGWDSDLIAVTRLTSNTVAEHEHRLCAPSPSEVHLTFV